MTNPAEPAWRVWNQEDDEAVVRLSTELYREDPAPRVVPPEHTKRTLEALRASPTRGLAAVLEVEGQVRGYTLLISFWSNELGGEVCEVDELFVEPDLRSAGLASMLLRSIADGSGPWPQVPVAVALQVTPENDRARQLYGRLGFEASKNSTMLWRLSVGVAQLNDRAP